MSPRAKRRCAPCRTQSTPLSTPHFSTAENGAGALVHVSPAPGGPEVGILPLEGRAPTDVLLGAVAPEHWSVLGVATLGTARPLDRPATSRPRRGRPVRAEVVVLVTRDGRVVGRVRQADRVFTEPPGSGLTLDCLQLALGLPTAPPDVPPAHLLAVLWLERLLRGEPPGRAIDTLPSTEGLDRSLDCGRLRQLTVEGAWPELRLASEDAAWLDDGAFSRWVMRHCRPLPDLLVEVRRVLEPAEAHGCIRLLRRLGLESTAAAAAPRDGHQGRSTSR